MQIILHKSFLKMYGVQRSKVKSKFKERRDLFLQDRCNPVLRNHKLHGKWLEYRSINITGDIRAVYREEEESFIFVAIGTHGELYGK